MSTERLDLLEQRLKALEDERAVARLLASYGPLVDSGDAEGAAALWAVDGVYDVEDWLMHGREAIVDMVRSGAHQGLITRGCCHFFGPPVVTIDGDEALAVCDSILMVRADSESAGYRVLRAGVHLISLRRAGESWEIVQRTARQLDGSRDALDLLAAGLAARRADSSPSPTDQ